ncbi:uncharacterized protein LOC143560113 [Bidens hawaiensis]|uniref:uncharacterized protein LOC143560113 n=1 Tax=Bidens hawaiensis TaxID=980011 RepID=UPI00404B08D5
MSVNAIVYTTKHVKKGKTYLTKFNLYMWHLIKKTDKNIKEYRIRLSASIIATKGLLNGALSFRGHDESEISLYRGHFIELLKLFGVINEEIDKVILSNAPRNNQMTAPSIQKEICNCFAAEVLKKIFDELGDDFFSILVDESRDVSKKEQMAMVLRYVDKFRFVKERFVGLVHVMETTALSIKKAIHELFAHYNLSLSRIRGQDGARNMSNEFNGLKALILKENSSAYFVHCFAHQLQLVVVALANKHHEIFKFFNEVSSLVNVVGASCKRHILGVTNTLCEALQRKDQDILNAIKLVKTTKEELQTYRLEGFDSFFIDVASFCDKYDIETVNMEAAYVDPKN